MQNNDRYVSSIPCARIRAREVFPKALKEFKRRIITKREHCGDDTFHVKISCYYEIGYRVKLNVTKCKKKSNGKEDIRIEHHSSLPIHKCDNHDILKHLLGTF